MTRHELVFSEAGDVGQVFDALSARYTVLAAPAMAGSWTCLDTPDWRLHQHSLTLRDARWGRRADLVLGGANGTGEPLIVSARVKKWPARVDSIPASELRDRVAAAVGIRALVPMAQVDVRSIPMTLLDSDQKTRVRVRVDQQRLHGTGGAPLPLRVLISALRGYEADAKRCASLLTKSLPKLETFEATATIAMMAAGHTPGQSTQPALDLDPDAPAVVSLAAVLTRWFDQIEQTVPGVLADLDTEYLHQLRTSVRATRSMIGQAGHLLPTSQVDAFAAEFGWLGSLTSPVRDLDVLLLLLAGNADIDLAGVVDLEPLVRQLTTKRNRAQRELRAGLDSPRFAELASSWHKTLEQAATPGTATSEPTAACASELAVAAYHRIVADAETVDEATPPNQLHHLRKQCKQMRYLLDGFASAFEPAALSRTLKSLKALQDNLGDIQDAEVQRAVLADSAAVLARLQAPVELLLSIGALRERIAARDAAARVDLADRLEAFRSKRSMATIESLGAPR